MKHRFAKYLIIIAIGLGAAACHSSRTASTRSHGSNSSTNAHTSPAKPRVDYQQMRQHVGTLKYDDTIIAAIIKEATDWIGTPYQYASQTREGTDCSGLILEVYRTVTGNKLPRNSAAQQAWCIPLQRDSIMPGDLLFFSTGRDSLRVNHVGLYIGNDEMIHASTSNGVIVSQIKLPYFTQHFHSAGRPPLICSNATQAPKILPAASAVRRTPTTSTDVPVKNAAPAHDIKPLTPNVVIIQEQDSIFEDFFN